MRCSSRGWTEVVGDGEVVRLTALRLRPGRVAAEQVEDIGLPARRSRLAATLDRLLPAQYTTTGRCGGISASRPGSSASLVAGVEDRVDLGACAHRLRGRGCSQRCDHELLEVQRVGGMGASVEHVEARDGQSCRCAAAGQPGTQRVSRRRRERPGRRHGPADDGVRAPNRTLFAVPSAAIIAASTSASDDHDRPCRRSASSVSTLCTARSTPAPANRAGSPSRSSTASRVPVEASEGTLPEAVASSPNVTGTVRVGRPRESSISSAVSDRTSKDSVMSHHLAWSRLSTLGATAARDAGAEGPRHRGSAAATAIRCVGDVEAAT